MFYIFIQQSTEHLMWTLLHTKVHKTLQNNLILPPGKRILVAVSGGQDSLCLLKIIMDLRLKWDWEIAIAHCDHGWPSDIGISDHVKRISKDWNIDFYLKQTRILKITESVAREWRYKALLEIAKENNFSEIVTGHTSSDLAETVIYNLIRGAGSHGLSVLTWTRTLVDSINLVRPLLNISRAETLFFCKQFNLPVWEDEVNTNFNYVRNRIRKQLVPYLKLNFNPQVEKTLYQTAKVLKAESDYLEKEAQKILKLVTNEEKTQLKKKLLKRIPLALQRRVIRMFLQYNNLRAPNFEQIEEGIKLINSPHGSQTSSFSIKFVLEVHGDYIIKK